MKWPEKANLLLYLLMKLILFAGLYFCLPLMTFFSARSDSESESARRIKTEFLVQMNGKVALSLILLSKVLVLIWMVFLC